MACKHCGQPSPTEMYDAAIKDQHNIVTWFGKTSAEILKALKFWDDAHSQEYNWTIKMEKSKMTREEAINKLLNVGIREYAPILSSLEALGLLKFEEPQIPPKKFLIVEGLFTRITMKNGNYFQGHIEHIEQD